MNFFRKKFWGLAASLAVGIAILLPACSEADASAPAPDQPPLETRPAQIMRDSKPINHSQLMQSHYYQPPVD